MNGFRGGFGGGFGGANLNQLMKQAQKMQEDMQKARAELESTEFSSSVGGGMVEAVMLGNKHLKAINIKKEIVDPDDVEMLEDLILAAVNDCVGKIEKEEEKNAPAIPGIMWWKILIQ